MDIGDIDRRNGRRRNAGPRFFRSCPSGLRRANPRRDGGARVGRTTLFRWLKRFRESARTSALAPRRRGPTPGCGRFRRGPRDRRYTFPGVLRDARRPRSRGSGPRSPPIVSAENCRFRPSAVCVAGSIARTRPTCSDGAKAKASRSRSFWRAGIAEAPAPLAILQMDHTKVDVTVVDPSRGFPLAGRR